jgi:hypothetical protein
LESGKQVVEGRIIQGGGQSTLGRGRSHIYHGLNKIYKGIDIGTGVGRFLFPGQRTKHRGVELGMGRIGIDGTEMFLDEPQRGQPRRRISEGANPREATHAETTQKRRKILDITSIVRQGMIGTNDTTKTFQNITIELSSVGFGVGGTNSTSVVDGTRVDTESKEREGLGSIKLTKRIDDLGLLLAGIPERRANKVICSNGKTKDFNTISMDRERGVRGRISMEEGRLLRIEPESHPSKRCRQCEERIGTILGPTY